MGIRDAWSSAFAAPRSRANPAICAALLLAAPLFASLIHALDRMSLQLRWKHQFRFAGNCAAVENGVYRGAGIGQRPAAISQQTRGSDQ